MNRLKLYDTSIPREQIVQERDERYLQSSATDKLYALLSLINVSVKLNGGQALKQPQRKGIVISRPSL